MGLVQIFETTPYPALLARELLGRVLVDWRQAARHWGMHLVLSRYNARRHGNAREIENLDAEIAELSSLMEVPERVEHLFSDESYGQAGGALYSFWALMLIRLCNQSEAWENKLMTAPSLASSREDSDRDAYRLPGFHPVSREWSVDWLEEFRYEFHRELKDAYPQLGRWLSR